MCPSFSGEQIQCLKGHYCEEGTTVLPGQGLDPEHSSGFSGRAETLLIFLKEMVLNLKGPYCAQTGHFVCLAFSRMSLMAKNREKLDGHNYARQDIFANLALGCVELRQ